MALKRQVLKEFWNETAAMEEPRMKLMISPELRQKLDRELLLETDIATVIEACENSGKKVLDPATGTFSGHLLLGHMTYWAEYRPLPGQEFELINAYGHRMTIEGE